jgi:2-polyprenyl-3-methyl-5-hydroxy-6-metoxy-1,4-benzoquinol methylase
VTDSRKSSYGRRGLSLFDSFGQFLSKRPIEKLVRELSKTHNTRSVMDLGCGFHAAISKPFWTHFEEVYLVDVEVEIPHEIQANSNVFPIVGYLPDILEGVPDSSMSLILANNILEHVEKIDLMVNEIKRLLQKDGIALVNVPNWQGKVALEFLAFRMGWAPREEMQDHKRYYSRRELWLCLRGAGFLPSQISVRSVKFGLNTRAVVRSEGSI